MDKLKLEQRLKELIKQDGRSQASMARKLGVSPDTFNKWVRGVNRLPDDVIAEFCHCLNLDHAIQAELMQLAGYVVTKIKAQQDDAVTPFKFATRIAPNGLALDPSNEIRMGATSIFAAFSPQFVLPGTQISVAGPDPSAYYSFLKVVDILPDAAGQRSVQLGWQWFRSGKKVYEFDMKITEGHTIWLNAFDYSAGGIFEGNEGLGRGEYQVVIMIAGNPTCDASFIVK